MSNVFHEIKRGFLILGFTGPLSSGCSTGANFFVNEINEYIKKRTDRALSKVNSEVFKKYNKLISLKNVSDLKKQHFREINRATHILKQILGIREIITILNEYNDCNFKYISMTDMLLKLTIKKLFSQDLPYFNGDINKLYKLIKFDKNKLNKALETEKDIKNRKISEITKGDIETYDKFLSYVKQFRESLKKSFSPDDLGTLLQDLGDNARRCGNPIDYQTSFNAKKANTLFILAEEANYLIRYYRNKKRSELGKTIYNEFAIEAFRNPYEVTYFRNRYYEFYLFSICTDLQRREKRENYNKSRDKRDQGEDLSPTEFFKQNVSECVYLSDIAINNDTERIHIFESKLAKYYALIRRPGCISPTDHELFMNQAYSMSLKSNCISRQVGAVVVDGNRGYIVGGGWNDVGSGQIPCGLRRYQDILNDKLNIPISFKEEDIDFRKFLKKSSNDKPYHSYCFKDEYSDYKTLDIICKLIQNDNSLKSRLDTNGSKYIATNDSINILAKKLSPKRLKFCRALHAEENAILQSSIIGGVGIEGATIYTTTFPCELCAKKIYQAKINKVVFTEPYPKSISKAVFFKDGSHVIKLFQFEGVKSHSYYKLFKSPVDKKEFQLQEKLY